jgi:hypothetical protein
MRKARLFRLKGHPSNLFFLSNPHCEFSAPTIYAELEKKHEVELIAQPSCKKRPTNQSISATDQQALRLPPHQPQRSYPIRCLYAPAHCSTPILDDEAKAAEMWIVACLSPIQRKHITFSENGTKECCIPSLNTVVPAPHLFRTCTFIL